MAKLPQVSLALGPSLSFLSVRSSGVRLLKEVAKRRFCEGFFLVCLAYGCGGVRSLDKPPRSGVVFCKC